MSALKLTAKATSLLASLRQSPVKISDDVALQVPAWDLVKAGMARDYLKGTEVWVEITPGGKIL